MLTCLRIRDLAIVRELEIELGPGLNVLTGETGAGKSIMVNALKLVLGARGTPDLVRTGADDASIEALFDLTSSQHLRARVAELAGAEDDELVVRRVLRSAGRSRAYVNGSLATAVQVSRLTVGLVDICSQHEHHSLIDAASHLEYLDQFAGLDDDRDRMRDAWIAFQAAAEELESLSQSLRERAEREAILRFQLEEIDTLDPLPDEEAELQAEHERLAHGDRLAQASQSVEAYLYADDDAVTDRLARLLAQLADLQGVDASLDPLIERLQGVHADLEDVARDLGVYSRGVVQDRRRLALVEDRLGALRRMARKYGGSIEGLLAHRARSRAELDAMTDLEARLDRLEARRQATADEAAAVAKRLSDARRASASTLGSAITDELRSLGMGDARVEVDVARSEARGGGLDVEGAAVTATGMDRVELLIAPNVGEPPKPLHRIASGGELSRSLLAIKRVLAARGARGLYVFDEVDTGVGGAVAEVIGRKLVEVARHHQVLCITHHAQIAAYADLHLHVSKTSKDGRTESRIRSLDPTESLEEIARMMGGIEVSDATRGAAAALIEAARAAKAR